jgi:CO/xanthine dehydrogenase Mo-binding subunit
VEGLKAPLFPVLPEAEVSATGQPVAIVVAETLGEARDARN